MDKLDRAPKRPQFFAKQLGWVAHTCKSDSKRSVRPGEPERGSGNLLVVAGLSLVLRAEPIDTESVLEMDSAVPARPNSA